MRRAVAVAALLLIAISGCGQNSVRSGLTPTAAPAGVTPISSGGVADLNTADGLIQWLDFNNLPCGAPMPVASPINGAQDMVDCGQHVVVCVYPSRTKADAAYGVMLQLNAALGVQSATRMLTGYRWTVSADDPAYLHNVQRVLGGVYQSSDGA